MHRLIALLAASCLSLLPLAATAQINTLPSQPHLLVRGKAEREVLPDRFTLNIHLEQTDMSPDLARKRAQDDAAIVLGLFHSNNALPDLVKATALSVQPKTRWDNSRQVFEGTQVSRDLSATFATLEQVRAILAGLKTSENVQVSGISPSYSEETKVRGELKHQAAEQTRVTAHNLAEAYGVKLGGIYTISEVAPTFAYGVQAGIWGGGYISQGNGEGGTTLDRVEVTGSRMKEVAESLEAGSITLTENVYAVFLIAQ